MEPFSYNWPYDFFSLVEFAKITAEVTIEPPEVEDERLGKSDGVPMTVARELLNETEEETLVENDSNITIGETIGTPTEESSVFSESWYKADTTARIFEDD